MPAMVRVIRNPIPSHREQRPWLVYCAVCTGNDLMGMFLPVLLAWAEEWHLAQDFATQHALAHEARRCTHCLNLPAGPLPNGARR